MISFLLYKDQQSVPATETGSQTGETGEERKEIAGEISDKEAGEEVKEEILVSPAKGKVVPLTEVRDETFASEMLPHPATDRSAIFLKPDMRCALPQKQGENC